MTRAGLPARESDLVPPVRQFLASAGYEVWVDPDGRGFFDVAARRGAELLLVELKLTDWRHLLAQAVARRGYADRVAVALPRESLARKLLARADGPASCVGVWWVRPDQVIELRGARPWPAATQELFAPGRKELDALLDARASGQLPEGIGWGGFPQRAEHRPGGRPAREWRIEEFPTGQPPDGSSG